MSGPLTIEVRPKFNQDGGSATGFTAQARWLFDGVEHPPVDCPEAKTPEEARLACLLVLDMPTNTPNTFITDWRRVR